MTIIERLGAENPVPSVSALEPTASDAAEFLASLRQGDTDDHATYSAEPDSWRAEDIGIVLDEMFEERTVPAARRNWSGLMAVVVAAVLIVGGVLLVTARNDATTDPASGRPAVPLSPFDPVFWLKVKDPVSGYRWSRVPPDVEQFGRKSVNMASVVAAGPGLVAVGGTGTFSTGDAGVWTSRDGTTWSQVPDQTSVFDHESGGVTWMTSVVDAGSMLVAVGGQNKCCADDVAAAVWISPDGVTWSRVPHSDAVFAGASMNSVATGGQGLVAVGDSAANESDQSAVVWTSANGSTWARVPNDETVFEDSSMASVTTWSLGLVAVGVDRKQGTAAVWTSIDGIAWARVPRDETTFDKDTQMLSVTPGGPGLVAVGVDWSGGIGVAAVWTSVDGIRWLRVPHDEAVFGGPDNHEMIDVVAGGPGLVAVGSEWREPSPRGAAVWTSPDGVSWSRVPSAASIFGGAQMLSVVVGGPGLVAVGERDVEGRGNASVWVASPD